MKKFSVFFMVMVLLFALVSCQKDQDIPSSVPILQSENVGTPDPGDSGQQIKSTTIITEYPVTPRFGKPNVSYYLFKVYDPAGTLALSVKLYDKATGTITYLSMPRAGNSWILSTQLSYNGWFEYRYVYTYNKANISTITYAPLCNTINTFSAGGISSISWPFGADGSSWNNRTVYVSPYGNIPWRGGEETKGKPYHYGFGWNEGTHIGLNERYSDDWNRGLGNQDLGAIIRTPLDGYIDAYGTYATSVGPSKYVAIIQQASDGNLYRFYVGHLQSYPSNLYIGKYVRAGIDQIGNLGSSGATSPHAHTNMRKSNNAVKFYFNAQ
jgi:hypothetical protein